MTILSMSFYGAIMILAVIVIRALFIHKLPKKTFLILWGIVMIRLLVPVSIPSALSIYTAAGQVAHPFLGQSFSTDSMGMFEPNADLTNTAQNRGSNDAILQNKIGSNIEVQDNTAENDRMQFSEGKVILFGQKYNIAVLIWLVL